MTQNLAERYVVESQIGAGGMGRVFLGRDLHTQKPVAIKQLLSETAPQEVVERFRREGEALRQLHHPNIVMLLDAFEQDGTPYLIMEYVSGGDLRGLLSQGRMPTERILRLSIDLADAITRAHKLDIIHRDLKPANVLITDNGTLKLTDFGVAHFGRGQGMTVEGDIIGTVDYLAPELLHGEQPDTRTDIWAFGVMLFEMVSGRRPFGGDTVGQVVSAILHTTPPDLEAECPHAPVALLDLIYRMLERDRNTRIPSVRIVGAELEAILEGRQTESRKAEPETTRFTTNAPTMMVRAMHNLPAQTTPFVGRDDELAELARLLQDPNNRLITIHAPGGMGKTRLSLECAEHQIHNFEHGVYFVQLAPLSDPAAIIPAIAEAVGYPFQSDGRDQKRQILDYLNNKHLLLVLDNYEHLMAGVGLTTDLLQGARQVRLLVTSRQRLNQSGETVFSLGAMEFPEWETPEDALEYAAVKLFLQSARRIRPDFVLNAKELPYVARICRLAQGMPLGILLAASWLSTLSPLEVADEMQHNLDFLESDLADLPERQRSMRAVFDYSWALLSEAEQQVFMRLSIFRGGFTREPTQEVAGANLRILMLLINKSLLQRDVNSGRYDVHELLRQYAQEKLAQSGESDAIMDKHSQVFKRFVQEREIDLKGRRQLDGLNELEADFDNVVVVWNRLVAEGDDDTLNAMLEGVYWFCMFRSQFQTGTTLFQRARERWGWKPAEQADLLTVRLHMRYPTTDDLKALGAWGEAAATRHGSGWDRAFCLRLHGLRLAHAELNQAGRVLLEQSLAIYEQLGDEFYVATVLDEMGWAYFLEGHNHLRVDAVQRAHDIRKRIGDRIGTANAQRSLAAATWLADVESTTYWLRQAYDLAREMKDRTGMAWAALLRGAQYLWTCRFDEASALIDEGRRLAEELNITNLKSLAYFIQAWMNGLQDDYVQGTMWAEKGMALMESQDVVDPAVGNFAIYGVAINAVGRGDHARAILQIQRMYTVVASMIEATDEADISPFWVSNFISYMPLYAGYLHSQGMYEKAVEILSGAINHPSWIVNWNVTWRWLVNLQVQLREALGDETYEAAWMRGKTIDLKKTIEMMLTSVSS